MLIQASAVLCGMLVLYAVVVMLLRKRMERRRAREKEAEKNRRCGCGYLLTGITLPRCPECGRAVGFDKTFEELGVRPEELRERRQPGA